MPAIKKLTRWFLLIIMIILAIFIAVYAFQYLSFKQTGFLNNKDAALIAGNLWLAAFYLHVSFGGIALLIGGFQFSESLRNKYPDIHRKIGIVYVVGVFIASTAGLGLLVFCKRRNHLHSGIRGSGSFMDVFKLQRLFVNQKTRNYRPSVMDD